jgi:cytochrome P450
MKFRSIFLSLHSYFFVFLPLFPINTVFLPFGGGPTYCPGRKFIRTEVKLFFMFFLLNLEIEFKNLQDEPGFDPARAGFGIQPPGKDVDAYFFRRPAN